MKPDRFWYCEKCNKMEKWPAIYNTPHCPQCRKELVELIKKPKAK